MSRDTLIHAIQNNDLSYDNENNLNLSCMATVDRDVII